MVQSVKCLLSECEEDLSLDSSTHIESNAGHGGSCLYYQRLEVSPWGSLASQPESASLRPVRDPWLKEQE